MSYLVTGGTGLLGSQIVKKLTEEKAEVVAFDISLNEEQLRLLGATRGVHVVQGDFSMMSDVVRVMREFNVEYVFHMGYLLSPFTEQDPVKSIRVNCEGTANIFEAAKIFHVKRVVFPSTDAVYGRGRIIDEESPKEPHTMYGAYKLLNEHTAMHYFRKFDLDIVVLRICSSFYGPGKARRGFGGLLDPLVENPVMGIPVKFPYRDFADQFIYSADVADLFCKACHLKDFKHRIINVGGGSTNRISDIVSAVMSLIPTAEISLGEEEWFTDPPKLDYRRMIDELKWSPSYTIQDGIKEWVDFLRRRNSQPKIS